MLLTYNIFYVCTEVLSFFLSPEVLYSILNFEYTKICPGNSVKYPLNTKLTALAIAKKIIPSELKSLAPRNILAIL